MDKKRVCVVGAGVCGMSAAKNLLEAGMVPFVLERTSNVGGLWVYTNEVGQDEFGLPVHSSMYKSLWTNLPKEVMTLPGHDYDPNLTSFLPACEIIKYLREYAAKFDIAKYVKFNHLVENVKPRGNVWDVSYKNLRTGETFVREFDYVMMCIGHYSVPMFPEIGGMSSFKGEIMHSHDYKTPEKFAGKTVCVQGAGPSGLDLALELTKVCKKVLFSHHLKNIPKMEYPPNIEHKSDIKRFDASKVYFVDGSADEIDVMLFCTGYLYDYPMLDPSCGITVEDNHVQPLYKHLVNIEHPSMCIVGIPFWVAAIPMFDLQVRYFVEVIKGNLRLPSKKEMYAHSKAYFDGLWERGVRKRHAHVLGPNQQAYYDSLSDEAKIEPLPPVMAKMHQDTNKLLFNDIKNMRKQNYVVLDKNTFVRSTI